MTIALDLGSERDLMKFTYGNKVRFLPGVMRYGVTRNPYGQRFVKGVFINEGDVGTFVEEYQIPANAFNPVSVWALVKVERDNREYYCPTPLRSIEIISYS